MVSKASAYQSWSKPDDITERYGVLVKRIAHHLKARLPPNVQLDDLLQAGMIGLLEASSNFDHSKGASFETFAGIRIRGAMLDEMRRNDWVPRSVHKNARTIASAIQEIEQQTGRDARDTEVAEKLGVTMSEYHKMLQDASVGHMMDFDDLGLEDRSFEEVLDSGTPTPYDILKQEGFKRSFVDAVTNLPEREKLVLSLYYDEELNLKEIGQVLGVSESRVSQINSQAMLRLQARLQEWRK